MLTYYVNVEASRKYWKAQMMGDLMLVIHKLKLLGQQSDI